MKLILITLVAVVVGLMVACGGGNDYEPVKSTSSNRSDTSTASQSRFRTAVPTQTAINVPSPAFTDNEVDELLEEVYWNHVDSIGLTLNIPEINRDLEFQEAHFFVTDFLFGFYDEGLTEIESYGIEPFSTWPYCISAISGAVHQAALNLSESPSESAPHIIALMEIIDNIHLEISPARERAGQPNKQKCDDFETEKRELMGWPTG